MWYVINDLKIGDEGCLIFSFVDVLQKAKTRETRGSHK